MNIYKLGIQILLAGLAGLLIVSCADNEEAYNKATPQKLELQAAIESMYSADKQYFSSGDRIGVYLVDYNDDKPGVLGDIANSAKNIRHTLQENNWISDAGKEIMLYSNTSDLYAYYPYDMEMGQASGKRNLAAYPFSIKSDQRTAVSESDFMWAKAAGLSNTNNRANITFEHLLSKLVVNMHYNDDIANDLDFKIHNTLTSSTINLRNGDVMVVGDKRAVYPAKNPNPEVGFELKYEAILIPQLIKSGTALFSIVVDGNMLIYTIDQNLELLPHKSYIFNLSIGEAKRMRLASISLISIEEKGFE